MSLVLDEPIVTTDRVTELFIASIAESLTQKFLALQIREIHADAGPSKSLVVKRISANLYEDFIEDTAGFKAEWLTALANKAGWEAEDIAEYIVNVEASSVTMLSTDLRAYVLNSSELAEVLQDVSVATGTNVYTTVKASAYAAMQLSGEVI
jgi:hypothetical protein